MPGNHGAAEFFRSELFNALMMVDRGYIDAATMTGSWAGAMGQTQFMPSSYMTYAVDFDGDGRRDIWKSTPDALASIANYLKGFGWNGDETWGREVRVTPAALDTHCATRFPNGPEGCYAIRNMTERRPLDEWRALGVREPTAVRCRTPTSRPAWSTSANASSSSTRTTTPSSATTAHTITR